VTRHIVGLLVAVAVVISAGRADSASAYLTACPSSNPPNELVLGGGSGQTAQLGNPFSAELKVQLANSNGCPLTGNLAGVSVVFAAPANGPSGIFAATGSRIATVGTDAQGLATAPAFTANDLSGSYTVDARSDYGSVALRLTNTSDGLAASITASGGSDQAAAVFGGFAQPLQARVIDVSGNPVQGASVTFSVLSGATGAGASFLGASQAVATTNATGIATSPPLTANGNSGRFSAAASVMGLSTVATTYTLDNHAVTQTLVVARGAGQSATINTDYTSPLSVRLLDSSGRPVEGVTVTFALGESASDNTSIALAPGAAFESGLTQAVALTDADGIATSPHLSANGTSGTFRATAATAGSGSISFALHNLAARIALSMRSRSAVAGSLFRTRLSVTARDRRNRPVRGVSVVFAVSSSSGAGASFADGTRQATVLTTAGGRAIAPPLLANTKAGPFTVTTHTSGSTNHAQARLRNRAARPATLTVGAASGESTPCSTVFPVPLAVTVFDRYGNRVGGVRVTFTAPSVGASGYFTVVRRGAAARTQIGVVTNANGIAIAPRLSANRTVGGYLVRAAVRGTSARGSFALINAPQL
jgi:hypothetical protein